MTKKIILILTPILFLSAVYFFSGGAANKNIINNGQKSDNQIINTNPITSPSDVRVNKNMELTKPSMQIDKNKNYIAVLKTSEGDIEISLNAKETPITVNNFVYLAKNKFYNGTVFHRVIKGFMIQGGDPECDPSASSGRCGAGGPGYKFDDEKFSGEYVRGTIAMANAGPNTNGSQFFIMHQDYPLPKNYVIFGKVVKGMDVVDRIASAQVAPSFSGELSKPINPVAVKSVEIIEQ